MKSNKEGGADAAENATRPPPEPLAEEKQE